MTQRFDALGRNKDGNIIDIHVTLIPIKTKDNMDIYVIVKNITDSKDQEENYLIFNKNGMQLMKLKI